MSLNTLTLEDTKLLFQTVYPGGPLKETSFFKRYLIENENRMKLSKVWNVLEGEEKDEKLCDRALAWIYNQVDSTFLFNITQSSQPFEAENNPESPSPAKVLWSAIKKFYEESPYEYTSSRSKLKTFRSNGTRTVDEHITEFNMLCFSASMTDDRERTPLFLESLPPDMKDKVHMLMDSKRSLTSAQDALRKYRDILPNCVLPSATKPSDYVMAVPNTRSENKEKKKELICYYCEKAGHTKNRCPELINKLKANRSKYAMAVGVVSSEDNDKSVFPLLFDTGASYHMVGTKMTRFLTNQRENRDIVEVSTANGEVLRSKIEGELDVNVSPGKKLKLKGVKVVDGLRSDMGIISLGCLTHDGYAFSTQGTDLVVSDAQGDMKVKAPMRDQVWRMSVRVDEAVALAVVPSESKSASKNLLHERCGHVNSQWLNDAKKHNFVDNYDTLTVDVDEKCEDCILGKQKSVSFPVSSTKTSRPLEMVHSDVCGPLPITSSKGHAYFVTFTDDFSKYSHVVPIARKSDVSTVFKQFVAQAERLHNPHRVVTVRSDGGGEYKGDFEHYCRENGIVHQVTAPYHPQQNGVAEKMNDTLMNAVRTLLQGNNVPPHLWDEALQTASMIRNMFKPVEVDGEVKSAWQRWYGTTPDAARLKVYGCLAFVKDLRPQVKKLSPRSLRGAMVGYDQYTKGWRIFVPELSKIVVSPNVSFVECKSGFPPNQGERVVTTEPLPQEDMGTRDVVFVDHQPEIDISAAYGGHDDQGGDADNDHGGDDNNDHVEEDEGNDNDSNRNESDGFFTGDEGFSSGSNSLDEDDGDDDGNEDVHQAQPQPRMQLRNTGKPRFSYRDPYRYFANATLHENYTPRNIKEALAEPSGLWKEAADKEMKSHYENGTWELVDRPDKGNVVQSKWVLTVKTDEDGNFVKAKARLVGKGYTQRYGLDFLETSSPVMKMDSLRTVLHIAANKDWEIDQIDVATAYLNAELEEEIFMEQPEGYDDGTGRVCRLKKAIYGLKQSARAWNQTLDNYLQGQGFRRLQSDRCVYVKNDQEDTVVLLVYVDDIVIASSNRAKLDKFKNEFGKRFKITDGNELKYILGVKVTRDREKKSILLNQASYTQEILQQFGMTDCHPVPTPMNPETKLPLLKTEDATYPYRAIVGSLLYLSNTTRPDLAHSVNYLARYVSGYDQRHWTAAKRVLRYLKGTPEAGIILGGEQSEQIDLYTDADFANDEYDRKSTSGVCIFLGNSLIIWKSKKQNNVATSTTEAEFNAASLGVQEAFWLRGLLQELKFSVADYKINLHCDNKGVVDIVRNPDHSGRTKHISVKICFVRDHVQNGEINVIQVPTQKMVADIMTKSFGPSKYHVLVNKLHVKW